jgi:hypothetical protein
VKENDLQSSILDFIAYLPGVLVYHALPGRVGEDGRWVTPMAGDKGFLDLVIAGPGGLLFRELKTKQGRVSKDQRRWLDTLQASGHDADVWRPADWPGRIIKEIKRIA